MGYDFLDRVDLSNFAVKLRASNELNLFHNALFASLKKSVSGVVDGARFVETYDNAKTIYLRPIVVYLDCDEAVRKGRFERLNSKLSWDQVTSLETERSVHDFRQVCSLCIRTNNITPQKVAGQIMDLFFVS